MQHQGPNTMRRTMKQPAKTAAEPMLAAGRHTTGKPKNGRGKGAEPWIDTPRQPFARTPIRDSADDDPPDEEAAVVAEVAEPVLDDGSAPDDALGLYLRQMGAIPLLDRDEERELAERLEFRRTRYRRA